MSELIWQCPICGNRLAAEGRTLHCTKRHAYDRAKSGYVHLLPSNRQHAKLPGDNPEMVRARRRFLEKGYYASLLTAIGEVLAAAFPQEGVLLDAGCGEGYYTGGVKQALELAGKSVAVYGVDISKTAVDLAARAGKDMEFAVGSVFHLPVMDASCRAVMSIFAPYCGEEFRRVLAEDGLFLMVIPAARHLWQLKAAVYETPYENVVKDYALEGFAFLEKRPVNDKIQLHSSEEIADLFSMTPYAYRTGAAERERLAALECLETEIAFEVLLYRKESF